MLVDDPRRAGHALTFGRAREWGGQRHGVTGVCSCTPARVLRFVSDRSPQRGGLAVVRGQHDRHIEEVEGPPLPELTRAQREALESYDDRLRSLTSGRMVTLDALTRCGLVVWERPAAGQIGGRWVPTEAGFRVVRLLRRAQAA